MNIFWYLLILVFFKLSISFGTLPVSLTESFLPFPPPWILGKPKTLLHVPGMILTITKKWRKVRAQHKEVSLQDIGQTFGCNMLKTVNLS